MYLAGSQTDVRDFSASHTKSNVGTACGKIVCIILSLEKNALGFMVSPPPLPSVLCFQEKEKRGEMITINDNIK
jgi:hypothetical protein